MEHLNNKVVFEDGSKMNIFRSKLKHVEFQNDNLGGVDYASLKYQQAEGQDLALNRKRTSTFQDYIAPYSSQETVAQTYF
jgi:hypothetical protein